jgi:hypothetical protein
MNKNFLFFITSFAFLKIVSSQDLETLCQTNNILNVVNAFKINDIIVLFTKIERNLYPIKMKDLKFNTKDKSISFSSAQVWNEWNALTNGTKVEQLKDIHSSFRISFPNKRSPLILAVYDLVLTLINDCF